MLFRQLAEYNTKRGGGAEISGNKFIGKEVIYWAVEICVEASLRQFKTTAWPGWVAEADLTHQAGHIGLIHTKQAHLYSCQNPSFNFGWCR